ncbi:MAG: hypothetical protein FWB95_06140 [Treponema sp.]|nr:hypothetical protein [Treponema sp.]
MKKNLVLCAFLIVAALVFFGCKDPEVNLLEQGPSTIGWIVEKIENIEIQSIDEGFSYSFDATKPPAKEYFLYYIEGRYDDNKNYRDYIVSNGTRVSIDRTARKGTVTGLKAATTYSVVITATHDDIANDLISEVKHVSVGYTSWIKGFDDLVITSGNYGKISYSFSETEPVADKYTIYFRDSDSISGYELINNGLYEEIEYTAGTLEADFTPYTNYSFIVVAEYNGIDNDLKSDVIIYFTEFDWDKGLDDFVIFNGDNHDELLYSFTHTVPQAHSYTLYYLEEETHDADKIINEGSHIKITDMNSLSGEISILKLKHMHSFVLVAEHDILGIHKSTVIHSATKYTNWIKEIENFIIDKSTFFQFGYSFAETNPAADTYTLYYYEGSTDNASVIINDGTSVKVGNTLTGTVKGLKGQKDYSIVVVAKHEDLNDLISSVGTVKFDWEGYANFNAYASDNEIIYSFNDTEPAADSYTLYYYKGRTPDPSWIMEHGISKTVEPTSSGKISDELEETLYSVMLVAEYEGFAPLISDIKYPNLYKGEINLSVTAGVNANGELTYKFSHSNPQADSYKLYYLQGTANDADTVINTGTGITVQPTQDGVIQGKQKGGQYRFVLVAESDLFGEVASSVASANIQWVTTAAQLNTNFVHSYVAAEAVMSYSFDHTTPPADSYWIYYLNNNTSANSASVVSNTATVKVEVTPTQTGKIKLGSGNNRVILVARYDGLSDLVDGTAATVNFAWTTTLPAASFNTPTVSATEFGQVTYTLTATNPPADSYTMYYLKSSSSVTVANIKANAATVQRSVTPGTETISILDGGTYYVFVEAKKEGLADTQSTVRNFNTITAAETVITQINNLPVVSQRSHVALVTAARTAFSGLLDGMKPYVSNVDKLIAAEQRIIELEKVVFRAAIDSTKDFDGFTNGAFNAATGFALSASVSNGFGDVSGDQLSIDSVSAEYTFKGLNVVNGKLTDSLLNETVGSVAVNKTGDLYILNFGSKLGQATGKLTVKNGSNTTEVSFETRDIERRLYDIAENRAKDYGAVEMFSYGNAISDMGSLGPNIRARGNTIVNYANGNGISSYFTTFSRGDGGLSGSTDATQLREMYYDGAYLYGRSQGGATNMVDGTNVDTAQVVPASGRGWDTTNSVASGHTSKWTPFVNKFKTNPFGYIPYNVQGAFTGYYQYQYINSGSTGTGDNSTSGRTDSPTGILELNSARGRLAHAVVNGTSQFQFTFNMDGPKTDNGVNIEWAGNVTTTAYGRSYVTFVIDSDMKFVKYHAYDRYTVTTLSTSSNTYATMYFMYHKNNIDFNTHKTYRGHRTRVNDNNYCDCTDCSDHITSGTNAVIANSAYQINLGWTESANETSKVVVPKP